MSETIEALGVGEMTFFTIPDEFVNRVPCQRNSHLYEDPALDIDLDEIDWLTLPGEQQKAKLIAKQEAERRAIDACNTCPLLESCREWALTSGVEVFGVVGGTKPDERNKTPRRRIIGDPNTARISKSERDEIIAEMMNASMPNKSIAERLGCSVRTVERRKAFLRASGRVFGSSDQISETDTLSTAELIQSHGDVAAVERNSESAVNDLIPSRVTDETAAIFDALADGSVKSRSALVESLVELVSPEQALSTAPKDREYESDEAKIHSGARKFLMNRLDIAMRRGRINFMKTSSNEILVNLDPKTRTIWNNYRKAHDNASAA